MQRGKKMLEPFSSIPDVTFAVKLARVTYFSCIRESACVIKFRKKGEGVAKKKMNKSSQTFSFDRMYK